MRLGLSVHGGDRRWLIQPVVSFRRLENFWETYGERCIAD